MNVLCHLQPHDLQDQVLIEKIPNITAVLTVIDSILNELNSVLNECSTSPSVCTAYDVFLYCTLYALVLSVSSSVGSLKRD